MTRKRRATGGRVDIAGVLYAGGLLDLGQRMMLQTVETWLGRVRRARGLNDAGPGGLWAALASGRRAGRKWTTPITSPNRRTAADMAYWRLCQVRNHFAEAGELGQLGILMRVGAGERMPADRCELEELH